MYWQYGSYKHAINEAWLSTLRTPLMTGGKYAYGYIDRYSIHGFLQAADQTQATLLSNISAMALAYQTQNQSAGLFLDTGAPVLQYQLNAGAAVGGVRVVQAPAFPELKGAQLSTFASYTIVLEAEYHDATVSLFDFHETLSFTGTTDGEFVFHQTLKGPPPRQKTCEQTTVHATQSGQAIGLFAYPAPMPPFWPDSEHPKQRQIIYGAPRRRGPAANRVFREFPVSWTYHFEDATQLAGTPNLWP